jgi:hypothetical protein
MNLVDKQAAFWLENKVYCALPRKKANEYSNLIWKAGGSRLHRTSVAVKALKEVFDER